MSDADPHAQDLDTWLAPFLAVMSRKTRRRWAPFYLRGLLGPGGRVSRQPIGRRLELSGDDQLQYFIASLEGGFLWTVVLLEAAHAGGRPSGRAR
ncbi:hypothetical protein Mnod_8350 (plasmid) [Methylobacterium nodulans ORS 2060]|uniref:Transposase IS701-like DDE domain-containing protein n=1 Tax=Methylobacterium nodulans (strain LMG 21967 / CNCM I-2342 / ORS 2060) TaxID=460265 RepID=B8IVP6_METNO|nr:hypothetical protein Mnod_8350 [Methylobacterium nodulans ORS 2060]